MSIVTGISKQFCFIKFKKIEVASMSGIIHSVAGARAGTGAGGGGSAGEEEVSAINAHLPQDKAAITIQKIWRGYKTRKNWAKTLEESRVKEQASPEGG